MESELHMLSDINHDNFHKFVICFDNSYVGHSEVHFSEISIQSCCHRDKVHQPSNNCNTYTEHHDFKWSYDFLPIWISADSTSQWVMFNVRKYRQICSSIDHYHFNFDISNCFMHVYPFYIPMPVSPEAKIWKF